jgi:hypothetical protein
MFFLFYAIFLHVKQELDRNHANCKRVDLLDIFNDFWTIFRSIRIYAEVEIFGLKNIFQMASKGRAIDVVGLYSFFGNLFINFFAYLQNNRM